jgi:hypothetical protein
MSAGQEVLDGCGSVGLAVGERRGRTGRFSHDPDLCEDVAERSARSLACVAPWSGAAPAITHSRALRHLRFCDAGMRCETKDTTIGGTTTRSVMSCAGMWDNTSSTSNRRKTTCGVPARNADT